MKILFLDFDGVLNSLDNKEANYFLWKNNPDHKSKDRFGDLFDERCVNWLSYIILRTDCKIVISSTWRLQGLKTMEEMWKERNLPGELIGITPSISDSLRGQEVKHWLENKTISTIQSYCIVDDDIDMIENQPLVKTNPQYGLTKKEAVEIINILNNEKEKI